ncbi:unnamed protein product [Rotaria magnacalcarata]|uniref:Uncharacterized protein n=2 Tax=Rotaria magnacalcarata TaxID=392030 RepID=A0A816GS58_9BILA|nr:unnamed protein product [Rotaria magnacalcarata]
MNDSSSTLPSILILSDSHGRNLEANIITPHYRVKTHSISGLQWINRYDNTLCLFSLIQQDQFSSLICSSTYVLFLLGTNSLRIMSATEVINQVDEILQFLYSRYHHLITRKIIITTCLPCLKPTKRFSSTFLLKKNIDDYNALLLSLSIKLNFLYLDLNITHDWLSHDMMHVHYNYRLDFSNIILNFLNALHLDDDIYENNKHRSASAIKRRNKQRNLKLKEIQKSYTISRDVSPLWSYAYLKTFLKYHTIQYASLSIMKNNILNLRFNNLYHLQFADHALPTNTFDCEHFSRWIDQNP